MTLADYKVKDVPPDIDEAAFMVALGKQESPVRLLEARAVYSYCVARQVSPAWLLAVFNHESSMGKAGTATQTHSWGNTRRPSFGVPDVGEVAGRSGTFSKYANWADGGVSTVARICDHKPYANAFTVREITPIWAPPTDQNDTERYIASVLADIARYAAPDAPQHAGGTMSVPKPPVDVSHPSPNRGGYANPHEARCVVWHITDGVDSLGWLTSPASQASANYLIARNGTIYELVPPAESAWANGKANKPDLSNPIIAQAIKEKRNLNTVSISVEHEGKTSAGKGGSLTTQQVDATVALTAWLCAQFTIAPDQTHIIQHAQVDSVDRPNCPGFSQAEWNSWVSKVAALVNQTPAPAPAPGDESTRLMAAYRALPAYLHGNETAEEFYEFGVDLSGLNAPTKQGHGLRSEYLTLWTAPGLPVYPMQPELMIQLSNEGKVTIYH